MNVLFIDDNELFVSNLFKQLKINNEALEKVNISLSSDLNDISNNVKDLIKDEDVIFININLKISNFKRQDFKGIELIKWFRLKEIYNHCVAYSFLSPSSIIKNNPLHSILYSRGITFIEAPFILSEVNFNNEEVAVKENLIPFFRAEVDLVKIRHELANIWGLERLKWSINSEIPTDISIEQKYWIEIIRVQSETLKNDNIDLTFKLQRNNLKKFFLDSKPKFFLYDDMALEWGPVLKEVLGDNFEYYTPAQINESRFINKLKTEKPKCLLLDLRLNNEKEFETNPLNLSGGRFLEKIKSELYSLPVIMFTATNKAESVRKLLSAGAEFVWTKEGIDSGINDLNTIKSTIELLTKIKDSVLKFKNKINEQIYEIESRISTSNFDNSTITDMLINGKLKIYNKIILDANFFLTTSSIEDRLPLLHYILIANKNLIANKKEIIIHEDVYNEIFRKSKENELKKNKVTGVMEFQDAVPLANFVIKVLYNWIKSGYVEIPYDLGQGEAISKTYEVEINTLNEIQKIDLEINSFFDKISNLFNTKLEENINKTNQQIEQINKIGNDLNSINKIRLYADDTFLEIIPNYLKNSNVCFITDDKDCAYSVGEIFNNANHTDLRFRYYKDKKGIYEAKLKVKRKGVEYFNQYNHLYLNDFIKLFR